MFIRLLVYLVLVLRLFAVVLIGVVFLVCGGCVSDNYFGFHLLAFYTFVIVALVCLVTLIVLLGLLVNCVCLLVLIVLLVVCSVRFDWLINSVVLCILWWFVL